jgi:hypothetical protein
MNTWEQSVRKRVWIAWIIAAMVGNAGSAAPVFAQERGAVKGRVVDATTNEPLVGANVRVLGTNLGSATDSVGQFAFEGLPPGTYAVSASFVGYAPYTQTDVVVSTVKPAVVRIALTEVDVQLEGVQITGSYFQKLPEAPLSSLVQSNEEIRRLPGGLEDVVRAISILPGVAQVQAGRNDLIVRGGAPSENLFVIDNIEVPNINHFGTQGASGGPLSYVNLDFVENTTFSTGGFGARYGDRLSSILAINLLDGRQDRLGGKATIAASQFGLNLEGPTGGSGDFILSARRSYLDFIFKAAGFGFVPEYWDFLAKTHYALGKSDQMTVLGIAALDNVKYFNDTEKKRIDNSQILGSRQNEVVAGVTWRHLFRNGFSTVTLGESYMDFRYAQFDAALKPKFVSNSVEREASLRADVLFHAGTSTEISAGVAGKLPRFSSDIVVQAFRTTYGDSLSVNASYGTNAFKGSAYAQLSQMLGFCTVTLGLRLDHFDLLNQPTTVSPRGSVSVPLSPVTNVSASVGRYRQSPSYVWLVANPANRELKSLGATHYIMGVDHLIRPDTRVSVEGYIKKYDAYPASTLRPYLIMANTGAGYGGAADGYAAFGLDPLVSEGHGTARGIEVLIQKKLSEVPCYGTVSVTCNVADFTALDGVSRSSSWDQRWILNVGGGYIIDPRWEIAAKFRFVSGRPYTPFNPDGTQNPALYNTVRIQPNHSLDLRVDRRWRFEDWTLITYADIQNIYNRKPVDVPRYNSETRLVEENDSIGLLPSIGISAEF